jgi:hypothetical protein
MVDIDLELGDNTPNTNLRGRRKGRVETAHSEGVSPFAQNVGRYTRDDGQKTDWEVENYAAGELPDIRALQEANPGFTYRFIRTQIGGKSDVINSNQAVTAGWEPQMMKDIPPGMNIPGMELDGVGKVCGVSGLILCRMPTARWQKLLESTVTQSAAQVESIGSEVRAIKPSGIAGPRVRVGSTRHNRAPIQDD